MVNPVDEFLGYANFFSYERVNDDLVDVLGYGPGPVFMVPANHAHGMEPEFISMRDPQMQPFNKPGPIRIIHLDDVLDVTVHEDKYKGYPRLNITAHGNPLSSGIYHSWGQSHRKFTNEELETLFKQSAGTDEVGRVSERFPFIRLINCYSGADSEDSISTISARMTGSAIKAYKGRVLTGNWKQHFWDEQMGRAHRMNPDPGLRKRYGVRRIRRLVNGEWEDESVSVMKAVEGSNGHRVIEDIRRIRGVFRDVTLLA